MDALIPPPRDDDDEDVYLALQTAKALWSRNERDDALRWLRRAAEQASDANADDRALELFKAAADVASKMQGAAPGPSGPPAAPSAPSARPPGPPPPPNRKPVELAPGPRGTGAPPPPGRPPPPGASTPPPAPAVSSTPPPAAVSSTPPPPYGAPNRGSNAGPAAPGGYIQTPPPPQARAPVPLVRPKGPVGAPTATPLPPQRPQIPSPAGQQARPMPSQPPGQPAPRAPASNEAFHRPGTVLGAGGPPAGSAIAAPESEDDGEAVTRVGKLPPEIVRSAQAQQPQRAAPPAAQPPAQQPQRKPARRRTLSRGETSPLAQGRRATHDGRDSRHDNRDSRSQHEGRASHAQHDPRAAQAAPAADPRKARSAPLPSEVPTAPGNDARAGAARAAALRALQLQDDEVTAQRDVAVLQRLKDLKDLAVDDLDEDTSVLPGLKVKEAVAAAVASKEAAAKQERRLEDELTRRGLDPRELTKQAPAASAAHAYGGSPDDDRPTPTEHDADFSATSPPDTSRTSTAGVEAAALAAETGRYSAIDALWATNDARGGRTATVHNPAASAQAAAADAAAVAAAAAAARQEATTITPMIAPMCAFRVAVLRPDASGAARVVALAPGAPLPAGAVGAMLVPTTEAESAELARIFGYVG